MRQARIDRAQIDCLAIGLGPGSYNGMRLAIALAQGWQLARPVKVVGISSVKCVAAEAQGKGICGRVEIVIDAQRNEVYLAGYDVSAESRSEVEPLRLATAAEVRVRQQAGGMIVGPEVNTWFPGSRVLFPRAATLGQLARDAPRSPSPARSFSRSTCVKPGLSRRRRPGSWGNGVKE